MKFLQGLIVALLLLASPTVARTAEIISLEVLNHPEFTGTGVAGDSFNPSYSADGKVIVFTSVASNLVANDANAHLDVFVWSAEQGIRLVSANTNQVSGNGNSYNPRVSADGQYVIFESAASDLAAGDSNQKIDIFMRNLANDSTLRISGFERTGALGAGDAKNPVISTNARRIFFESSATNQSLMDTNGKTDVILYDWSVSPPVTRLMSTISNINATSSARGESTKPLITPDGRWLIFNSRVDGQARGNNVAYNILNYATDLYVRDLQTNVTRMVRPGTTNLPQPGFSMLTSGHVISANSKAMAFRASTNAYLKSTIYYYVFATQSIRSVTTNALPAAGSAGADTCGPVISADGNRVVYADAKGAVYMFNANNGSTIRIPSPTSFDTNSISPVISPDGFSIMFYNNNWGWCLTNLAGGSMRYFIMDDWMEYPVFNPNSLSLSFNSSLPGYVPEDQNEVQDIFIHEFASNQKTMVTVPPLGFAPVLNAHTVIGPNAIATNNSRIVFTSWSDNIVAGDLNGLADVFVRDIATGEIELVSVDRGGVTSGNGISRSPVLSANGRYVAFTSTATNLVNNDNNLAQDVFLRDLEQGTTVAVSRTPAGATGNRHSLNPSISGDGKYVVYQSYANNLVTGSDIDTTRDTFLYNRETGVNRIISMTATTASLGAVLETPPLINQAGTDVFFIESGLYHYDIGLEHLRLVTPFAVTNRNHLAIGRNSSKLFYRSSPQLAVSVYDSDLMSQVQPVTVNASGQAAGTSIDRKREQLQISASADGRYVVFVSRGTHVGSASNTNQVYIADLVQNQTRLVSVKLNDLMAGNGPSDSPSISADGRYIAFRSYATNLVVGDTNNQPDIFLRDMQLSVTTRLTSGNQGANQPYISDDGSLVVFNSESASIETGLGNGLQNTYAVRLQVDVSADSDGDGLDDAWEMANFGNLSRDGSGDADGDGASDSHEYLSGTNPQNDSSVFEGQVIQPTPEGVVRITWPAVEGKTYRVQYKNSLTDANWTNVTASVVVTGNTGSLEDVPPADTVQRYYRVVLE